MKTEFSPELKGLLQKPSLRIQTARKPSHKYPYWAPSQLVTCECEINFDGRTRLIRYVKGMPSIFVDEWTDEDKKKRPEKIKLRYGSFEASTSDTNLIAYLYYSGQNKANKETKMPITDTLFEIVDLEKRSEDAVKKRQVHVEAEYFINTAAIQDLRGIAMALAKSKSEVDSIRTEEEFTLRFKMRNLALTKPEVILNSLKSPELKNKVLIYNALQNGVIKMSDDNMMLSWKDGDTFVTAPHGMGVVDWFADLADKNEDYGDIIKNIKIAIGEKSREKDVPKTESLEEQIVQRAIKNGKVVQSGNWFLVPVEGEEEPKFKFNGKKNLISAIEDNEDNIVSYIY